jgi:hypothetical protein
MMSGGVGVFPSSLYTYSHLSIARIDRWRAMRNGGRRIGARPRDHDRGPGRPDLAPLATPLRGG